VTVEEPDLLRLKRLLSLSPQAGGELFLDGVLVEHDGQDPIRADRVQISESELHGLALEATDAPGLRLTDVLVRDCDLSNVDAREGSFRRVDIRDSRFVGFGLAGGTAQDLKVIDSSLELASLAFAQLRNVVFERVKLAEASFMEARLESVEFIACELAGADFRRVELKRSSIRGSSLDGVLGVEYLKGLAMPWSDVLASAGAPATALGITVESD
jgi:uncharacterized protein YjbI with pentapeptide repeats